MDQDLKDRLDRIDTKLDKLDERQDLMNVTLVRQAATLEDHTRRSLANEEALEVLRQEVKPLITTQAAFGTMTKIVIRVGAVLGVLGAGFKVAVYLLHLH